MQAAAAGGLTRVTGAVAAVANAADDLRARKVRDADNLRCGRVRAVFVDDVEHRPRFLVVGRAGFLRIGARRALLPVDVIRSTTLPTVWLRVTRDRIAGAPGYDGHRLDQRDYLQSICDYYRQTPYWADGYVHPDFNS